MNPDKFRKRRLLEIQVEDMREAGHTIREIAAETGVSVGTVHNVLRRSRAELEAWRKATAKEMGWEYAPLPRPTVKEINRHRKRNRERAEARELDWMIQVIKNRNGEQ